MDSETLLKGNTLQTEICDLKQQIDLLKPESGRTTPRSEILIEFSSSKGMCCRDKPELTTSQMIEITAIVGNMLKENLEKKIKEFDDL